jgi:hypothetical protein
MGHKNFFYGVPSGVLLAKEVENVSDSNIVGKFSKNSSGTFTRGLARGCQKKREKKCRVLASMQMSSRRALYILIILHMNVIYSLYMCVTSRRATTRGHL